MNELSVARGWLDRFQDCVRGLDYAGARALFDPDVKAYGSLAGNLEGLQALEARQWRRVWPWIRDFTFQADKMRLEGTVPSGVLTLALPWSSRGVSAGDPAFDRPGRATLVLRLGGDGAWRCVHSHYSLLPVDPGAPR
ncbi:MAG TPA: nuclear transport factor 2 family protein [bacterium]|nr:nuclear transport factor 2 family protein [bacterium]